MYSIGFVKDKSEQRRCLSIQEGIMGGPVINSKCIILFHHLHKSRLCVVPYTGLDLLEPLAGGDVIKWVKTEQVV